MDHVVETRQQQTLLFPRRYTQTHVEQTRIQETDMKVGDLYVSKPNTVAPKGHTIVITKLNRQSRIVDAIIVNSNKRGSFTIGYIERNYRRAQ